MSHSGDDNSDAEEEGYNTEFRSYPDDAWYSVRVLLEGELGDTLRIKYDNFTDDQDNVFLAESFKSEDELYDFIGRFRKVSAQLQDPDCPKVVKGMRVCASDSFSNDDIRFYDAIVDDVLHKNHSNVNGKEECECECTFLLFWLHGPNVGNVTDKGVADVCLLQDSELQPKLASFMEIALQKIEKALSKSVSGTSNDLACNLVAQHNDNKGSTIVKRKSSFAGRLRQGKRAWRSLSTVWPSEGETEVHCAIRQDTDHEYIFSQVYRGEPYTNGVIMLDCQKDLEHLFGFLQNPNHFIVSLNGRPWVATEKMSMSDHWTLMLGSPNKLLNRRGDRFSNELKVVCSGTEEYTKAKELRDLYLQFIDHQRGLFKKLHMEERSIS